MFNQGKTDYSLIKKYRKISSLEIWQNQTKEEKPSEIFYQCIEKKKEANQVNKFNKEKRMISEKNSIKGETKMKNNYFPKKISKKIK